MAILSTTGDRTNTLMVEGCESARGTSLLASEEISGAIAADTTSSLVELDWGPAGVSSVRIDVVDEARLPARDIDSNERKRGRRLVSGSLSSSVFGASAVSEVADVELLIRKISLSDDFDRWSFARTLELALCLLFSGGMSIISPGEVGSEGEEPEVMSDIDGRTAGSSPESVDVFRALSGSAFRDGGTLSTLAGVPSIMVSILLSTSLFGKSVFPNSLNP